MTVLTTSRSKLEWHKSVSGTAISARAGNYRFHRSGDKDYTVYRMNPFIPLGRTKSVPDAMTVCQQHSEAYEDNE